MLASATDVATRRFPLKGFPQHAEPHRRFGSDAMAQLCQGLATRLHRLADQLASRASTQAGASIIEELVARAVAAQRAFETWPEERVDALLRDVA